MKDRVVNVIYLIVALSVFVEIRINADPFNINATNILLITCLFITLYHILRQGQIRENIAVMLFLGLSFLLFSSFSLRVEAGEGLSHMRSIVTLTKGVMVIFLISYWLTEYNDVRKVARAFILAGVLAFLGAFIQGTMGISNESIFFEDTLRGVKRLNNLGINLPIQRAPGFLGGYGLLGVYIETAALLSAIGFLRHGRRQGMSLPLAIVGVVLAIMGLLVSQSRSGLVATVVGYSVFYTLTTLVYSRYTFMRMALLAVLSAGLIYFWLDIWSTISSLNRNSIAARIDGYVAALEALKQNPMLGIGFSNMKIKLSYYRAIHNSYLNLLTGGGLLSFVLYLYFKVKAIKGGVLCLKASDPRAPLAIGLLSALAAAVVECLLWGGGVFATAVFIIIGLLISLGQAVNHQRPVRANPL